MRGGHRESGARPKRSLSSGDLRGEMIELGLNRRDALKLRVEHTLYLAANSFQRGDSNIESGIGVRSVRSFVPNGLC